MIGRIRALPAAQQIALACVVAAAIGALAVVVPRLGNAALLVASAGLIAVVAVLGQWLWQHEQRTDWSNAFTEATPPRGADPRISRLAEAIRAADAGNAQAQLQLHGLLSGLAEHQDALGADLAAYLATPPSAPTARLTTDRLDRFVTTLEDPQ